MRDSRHARVVQLLLLLSLLTSIVQAQSSSGQQITSSVIAGGCTSGAGSTQVDGTLGQSFTGTSHGGSFSLSSGFWSNASALTTSLLTVSDISGTYGGMITLNAALTANGAKLSGQTVSFSLNGTAVGTATTDSNGLATLTGVTFSGLDVGAYPSAIMAQFAGDASFVASTGSGQLSLERAAESSGASLCG